MSFDPLMPPIMSDEDTQRLRNACGAGDLDAIAAFSVSREAHGLDLGPCNWALIAVQQGNEKLAIFLIEHGLPFNPFLEAEPPALRSAAYPSLPKQDGGFDKRSRFVLLDYEVTKWFLDHGASPNARGRYDDTPLSFAVHEASMSTIQLLLDRGGDVQQGQLLHHATWRTTADRLDVLQLLWDQGLTQSAINKIKYQDIPPDYQLNKYGEIGTPQHNAVRVGNLDTVKWLVEHGANPLVKDPRGRIPVRLARDLEMMEIAEYLAPLSVVDDKSTLPDNFTDLPGNRVETYEKGQAILIQYYQKHDPSRLYEQDGRFHIRQTQWSHCIK